MSQENLTAREAIARLVTGNRRYVQNVRSVDSLMSHSRRALESVPQRPFAVVLGCSDSRAPAEMVFDQGLGDLFVIRVAGNIVAPSQVGSVEFAAEHFGTRLVLVMGHTSCGAIDAALEAVLRKAGPASRNLMSIVDRVRPSIESLVATDLAKDSAAAQARGDPRQRARLGEPPPARLGDPRAARRKRGAARGRGRARPDHGRGRFLRRHARVAAATACPTSPPPRHARVAAWRVERVAGGAAATPARGRGYAGVAASWSSVSMTAPKRRSASTPR